MRKPERTMQQLDPLAAGTNWDVAVFFSVISWVYAVLVTVPTIKKTDNVVFLALSILVLTVAVMAHLWFAAPRHAPYTRGKYGVFVFLAISAAVFQIASDGVGSISMLSEWGPIVLALLFASASGYRSLPDQYYAGLSAVVVIAGAMAINSLHHELPFGVLYFCVSGVALIAIVVLGQASYTFKASRILMAWQATVNETAVDPGEITPEDVAGPLTLESRDFLVSLLENGRVTEQDTERARELASSIRSELVLLADQTWVERSGAVLLDPEGVLRRLELSAQSAISALITGLSEAGVQQIHLSLRKDPASKRLSCVVQGTESSTAESDAKLRTLLASFLRVMYVVFEDVRFINNDGQVNVMFYYAP